MASTVVLPATFPLVGLGLASTLVLTLVQGSTAMSHRKSAKVEYPNLYASEDAAAKNPAVFKYNCAQRAHQNTVESVGQILALTLFLGLFNPIAATTYNLLWVAGRFLYGNNYVKYGPSGRNNGVAKIAYIGLFGLFFSTIYYAGLAAYKLAL